MFGQAFQERARRIAEYAVRPLAALGLTPNLATLIGLLLNALAAAIIATGQLRLGGIALLIAGLFDMVDGALARVRNQKTAFGAFFDSTVDRYSEGLTLLGVIVYALRQPASTVHGWEIALAYLAALGSLMVSYARARAEGLGLTLKTGLMARPERVLLLAGGLIIGGAAWLPWTLLALAVTSVFTSIQRIVDVWRMLPPVKQAKPVKQPPSARADHADHADEDAMDAARGLNGFTPRAAFERSSQPPATTSQAAPDHGDG
jgi:CDP-diacylglycerol--glycerol-3-phosphate 3-phosphatidyltransferase